MLWFMFICFAWIYGLQWCSRPYVVGLGSPAWAPRALPFTFLYRNACRSRCTTPLMVACRGWDGFHRAYPSGLTRWCWCKQLSMHPVIDCMRDTQTTRCGSVWGQDAWSPSRSPLVPRINPPRPTPPRLHFQSHNMRLCTWIRTRAAACQHTGPSMLFHTILTTPLVSCSRCACACTNDYCIRNVQYSFQDTTTPVSPLTLALHALIPPPARCARQHTT